MKLAIKEIAHLNDEQALEQLAWLQKKRKEWAAESESAKSAPEKHAKAG